MIVNVLICRHGWLARMLGYGDSLICPTLLHLALLCTYGVAQDEIALLRTASSGIGAVC